MREPSSSPTASFDRVDSLRHLSSRSAMAANVPDVIRIDGGRRHPSGPPSSALGTWLRHCDDRTPATSSGAPEGRCDRPLERGWLRFAHNYESSFARAECRVRRLETTCGPHHAATTYYGFASSHRRRSRVARTGEREDGHVRRASGSDASGCVARLDTSTLDIDGAREIERPRCPRPSAITSSARPRDYLSSRAGARDEPGRGRDVR